MILLIPLVEFSALGLRLKLCFLELSSITCLCFLEVTLPCLVSTFRQTTQDAPEEVRNRDFRRELEERERAAAREKTETANPRYQYHSRHLS